MQNKKIGTRLMSIVISLVMAVTLIPMAVFASNGVNGEAMDKQDKESVTRNAAANYSLFYNQKDGKFHKNSLTGDVVKSGGEMKYSGDGTLLVLDGFKFETSAPIAMVIPKNTVMYLEDKSDNTIASIYKKAEGTGEMTAGIKFLGKATIMSSNRKEGNNLGENSYIGAKILIQGGSTCGGASSYGIYGTDFILNGASLEASTGSVYSGKGSTTGIYGNNITIKDGMLVVKSHLSKDGASIGIDATKQAYIEYVSSMSIESNSESKSFSAFKKMPKIKPIKSGMINFEERYGGNSYTQYEDVKDISKYAWVRGTSQNLKPVINKKPGKGSETKPDITSPSSKSFTINAIAGTGGRFNAKTVKVAKGESTTLTITPNKGYKISDVLVNGKSVGKKSTYTFTNVTKNQTIHATFKKIPHNNPQTGVVVDKIR